MTIHCETSLHPVYCGTFSKDGRSLRQCIAQLALSFPCPRNPATAVDAPGSRDRGWDAGTQLPPQGLIHSLRDAVQYLHAPADNLRSISEASTKPLDVVNPDCSPPSGSQWTLMCSLGHGLRTFTAVPTSRGRYIDRVLASAGVKTEMLPLSGGR